MRHVPSRKHRWLKWLGRFVGHGLIVFLAWHLDWHQFAEVLRDARLEFVFATFVAITLEQVVRAWKWRQILAVPYNDIVARSIPSARRSRLLALRFFAGGLLALGVLAVAGRAIDAMAFPVGHALVLLTGAGLLLVSAIPSSPPASRWRPSLRTRPASGDSFGTDWTYSGRTGTFVCSWSCAGSTAPS